MAGRTRYGRYPRLRYLDNREDMWASGDEIPVGGVRYLVDVGQLDYNTCSPDEGTAPPRGRPRLGSFLDFL